MAIKFFTLINSLPQCFANFLKPIVLLNARFGSFAVLRLNSNCSVRKIKVGAQKRSAVGQKRTLSDMILIVDG